MSSFLCFICHSTVNSDTNEETREKYREVVGMNLCPDSHLCHICCHVLNKLWLFQAICLKRSLEYPVLFSEKGTINLQRNDLEIHTVCPEDTCGQYHNRNVNSKSYHIHFENYNDFLSHHEFNTNNQYVELEEERTDFDEYFNPDDVIVPRDQVYETKDAQTETKDAQIETKDTQTEIKDTQIETKDAQTNTNEELEQNVIYTGPGYTEEDVCSDLSPENVDREENCENFKETNPWSSFDNENQHTTDQYTEQSQDIDVDEVMNGPVIEPTLESTAEINIESYDSETANELNLITENDNELAQESTKKKKKTKKRKEKQKFEKIILTLEQQKAELEGRRKEKKYLEAEFKCYNCAVGFLYKDSYQTHMMRHEESNGEYRCDTCALRFANPAVLRSHRAGHAERHRCTRCGEAVRVRGRQTHARRCWNQNEDVAACHLCASMFKDSSGLQQHLKRYHQAQTSSRGYPCSVCGSSYGNQAAMRTHMLKHTNKKFDCDKCESTFSSPYTLTQHKKKHEAPAQTHYCTTCNVSFSTRKSLLAHRRNALTHQQTIFECPICSRACPNRRALALHMETVHSDKRHACPTCPARYSSRKALVRHVSSHVQREPTQGTRVAVCHLCGASFKANNKLNRHLREVCEKAKLEEEFASLYDQSCMTGG